MMKKQPWKEYLLWIILCEAVGIFAGLLSMKGMAEYQASAVQPPAAPPPVLFPIVWTLLYALMGISMARVRLYGRNSEKNQNIFIVQLVFNFFWTLIFFNAKAYGFAFVWILILWILIAAMIRSFRKQDSLASLLQIPYLLWVSFAAYLNFMVWQLNQP